MNLPLIFSKTKIPAFLIGAVFLAGGLLIAAGVSAADAPSGEIIDSDGDGYGDQAEIKAGYSPFNPENKKITRSDMDSDGLSDYWEIKFKTDPLKADTDGDGYRDGEEIDWAHDPLSTSTAKLSRKIEIDTKKQKLTYLVAGEPWKEFSISSGKPSMPTPKGKFKIINKSRKAWSNKYKLWMPYWLGLDKGEFGIHELPLWPNGYREGADHLGRAVSHGCVRLGIGSAQYIYDRLEKGVEVLIK